MSHLLANDTPKSYVQYLKFWIISTNHRWNTASQPTLNHANYTPMPSIKWIDIWWQDTQHCEVNYSGRAQAGVERSGPNKMSKPRQPEGELAHWPCSRLGLYWWGAKTIWSCVTEEHGIKMEVQQHCAEVAHCSEQNAVKKMEVKKKIWQSWRLEDCYNPQSKSPVFIVLTLEETFSPNLATNLCSACLPDLAVPISWELSLRR